MDACIQGHDPVGKRFGRGGAGGGVGRRVGGVCRSIGRGEGGGGGERGEWRQDREVREVLRGKNGRASQRVGASTVAPQ